MSIPITAEEVKVICNLTELRKLDIIEAQFPLVDAVIKELTNKKDYNKACRGGINAVQIPLTTAFKHAFAYLVYANIIDLLNTSTSGSGIIKTTGYSDSRIELLSEGDALHREQKLQLKAFETIKKYLNPEGIAYYEKLKLADDLKNADESLKPQILAQGKKCRATLI